jgi:hypothetical protein
MDFSLFVKRENLGSTHWLQVLGVLAGKARQNTQKFLSTA